MATEARHLAKERVGTRLAGKWFLDDLLGYGGSAAVYAATHRNGKRAAIKILHPHCVSDEQLRTRFVREGYVANKIGHPGAVSVLDDDIADGIPYLVMELLEGMSLERCGRGDVPAMTVAEVIRIADDLLDVLAKAHEVGVVHRDIKPANLFVTHEGQLKVLDFGIARLAALAGSIEGGTTQTGLMMGTPAFMPPEQARARWNEVDGRSDLWAAGATMIGLLLGRRPRIAETANEELLLAMTEPMPPAAILVPALPPALAQVIDKAVMFQREDRWPNARAMQQALREATSTMTPAALSHTMAIARPYEGGGLHGVQNPNANPNKPNEPMSTMLVSPMTPPFGSSAPLTPHGRSYPHVAPASSASMLDVEPAPSLTTSRAVLHTAPPPPSIVKRSSNAPAIIALSCVLLLGVAGALGLYAKHNRTAAMQHPTTTTAAAAAPETANTTAAASPVPSPAPTETEDPPPTTTTTTPAPPTTMTTTTSPSSSSVSTKPQARPPVARPQGSGAANPAKYFDSRF